MIKISRRLFVALLTFAWLCPIQPVMAGESPDAFIARLAAGAIENLTAPDIPPEERQERFRTMLQDGFDLENVSNFLLGPFRRKASDEEIDAFRSALEDNVVVTYAWRFASYNGQEFNVGGVRDGSRGQKVVSSTLKQNGDAPPVTIEWRLTPHDDSWRIFDIVIEGLSMLVTQRDEYAAVIRRNDGQVGALIDAIRAQNEKLRNS
ncbi:ABC transporter substrate-binding protein [Hwanghaeella grinnelliae]|uniref:ABC transporter substrate-binding protein n=1 Tax=Hwanghaeella grinnelliae TaxID=2500179 RepID=A0A3S2VQI7_9PROT|nr:ABC transporter substrate-binding protein [Hwanghaeella grinnelliae]RVU37930.1 ABC transporter substrate-binding protein [Hwanghaeella grinnelliae]